MTNARMGRRHIDEASGRMDLVRLAVDKGFWATGVREARECVELFPKGALRLVSVEPLRVPDVAEMVRREGSRFPGWFRAEIAHLAAISAGMAGGRGLAFYGDERQELGPQGLLDERDALRVLENAEYVAGLCRRLLNEASEPEGGRNG